MLSIRNLSSNLYKFSSRFKVITLSSPHQKPYSSITFIKTTEKNVPPTRRLISTIESCIFKINDHYRKKEKQQFAEGLLHLKECCAELDDETERKLDGKMWNFLIQQFCRSDEFDGEARFWFQRIMKEKKLAIPNAFTLNAVLKAFSNNGALEMCEEILKELEKQGLCNVFSYIYFTKACLQNGKTEKAFSVIQRMESQNIEPSFGIFIPLLKEATNQNNKEVGLKICDMVKKSNLYSPQLSSSVAAFALKVKRPDIAIEEYEKLQRSGYMTSVITWTCLIQAYIQQQNFEKAISIIGDMKKNNVNPDCATFTILLSACAKSNKYEEGVKIHELAKETLKEFSIEFHNLIIYFYTKCGHSDMAIEEYEKAKQKGAIYLDAIAWNCLIQEYIKKNNITRAIAIISHMKDTTVTPNPRILTTLLKECTRSNNYEEGVKLHELSKQILKEFSIEFQNFVLCEFAVSSFYNAMEDLYRNCLKGQVGFIIVVDCLGDVKNPSVSDTIEVACIDDSKYQETKPLVYMKKNHRSLLFILKGENKEFVQKAEEEIENSLKHWNYETDKYYIAYHSSTYQKETIYEGLEWFFYQITSNSW